MTSSVISILSWQKRVAEVVPSLSPSQAKVLGLISYGIVLFDGCGLTRLSNGLAKIEQVSAARLRYGNACENFTTKRKPSKGKNGATWMCEPVLEICLPGLCETGKGRRGWRWP